MLPPLLGYAGGLLVAGGPSYVSVNSAHKVIEKTVSIEWRHAETVTTTPKLSSGDNYP
ncbi:hypothetical protein WEI85_48140 [Actinomycetes bacterium KLBMP 9797]